MAITIANTDANLTGDTILTAENSETKTGLLTFDRDPSAPFAVSSGSAVVSNLDADKLDGQEGTYYLNVAANHTAEWTSVTHAGGNFTATGGGSWTVASGDQITFKYLKIGKLLHVICNIDTSTVAGTVTALNIAIPGGFTAASTSGTACIIYNNSGTALEAGLAQVTASGTVIALARNGGSAFSASTDLTYVRVQIMIETTT